MTTDARGALEHLWALGGCDLSALGVAAGQDRPKHLPAQALDHGTGYLAAFAAMTALARRAREGGSYLVRLSLARTGRWIDGLGRVDGVNAPELRLEDINDLLQTSETPARWARPAVPLGTHVAEWPPS